MSPINRNDQDDKVILCREAAAKGRRELLTYSLGIPSEERRYRQATQVTPAYLQPSIPISEARSFMRTNMKTPFLVLSFALASILTIAYTPFAGARAQQDDANQVPAGASATTQDGPGVSRRGGEGRGRGVFGKISALQADSIEVTGQDGTKVSVKLTSGTEFRKARQPAKIGDFKVGDMVMVRTDQSGGNGSGATAVMVAAAPAGGFGARGEGRAEGRGGQGMMQGTMGKDYVLGEVKSVDPPKLTVKRVDNVTQTLELNEDTSLRRGRDSITMADIQAGDHIFARGTLANSVFVPKGVNVIPPEQWKRMQEMMKEGGEGRGGSPQNAPTPSAPATPATPPAPQNPPERSN